MSAQHEEELVLGDQFLLRSREVFNEVLKPVDGVRGTWSWMLEEGNHGYGVVPFIIDLDDWDGIYRTVDVTKNQPEVLPAFVEWKAPSAETYSHFAGGIPVVEIIGGWWLGQDFHYPLMAANNWWIDEDCYYDFDEIRAFAPLWSVTPIDVDTYTQWADAFEKRSIGLFDSYVAASLTYTGEDCHREYEISDNVWVQCPGNAYEPDRKCLCGLEQAQEDMYRSIYEKELWTDPGPEFHDVWKWTTNRWLDGWQAMNTFAHTKTKDPLCPSSLVSSRSPYFRTLALDALTQEKERLSLTHSTSSPLWQESLTEPSPQLTLFDT